MMRTWAGFLAAVLIGVILAVFAILPPAPKGVDTPLDQFSSARAMKDVRIIAAEPHPAGSPENADVRTYIGERLQAMGLEVTISIAELDEWGLGRLNRWGGTDKTEQTIYNIIGVLPGKDRSKPALMLMAHHDTVWASPGAADATIGVASMFEILRAVQETGQPERDLVLLFTDAEELGLVGAENFFEKNPMRHKIGAIINFEARGGGGTANMFQTSAANGEAVKLYARSVKQPSVSSLSTFVYSVLPNDTDLTPALEGDYVAYNIANIGRAGYYHSPKITADALEEASLQHMGSQGLDLTRALLAADGLPAQTKDAIFFDLYGFFTVIFASFWGWIFLGVAAVLAAFGYDRKLPRKQVLTGAVLMLGFVVLGGGLLYILNIVSGAGANANYYDRLAAIPKLEVLALLLCLAVFFAVFGRKKLTGNERIGAALPLFVLAIVGQALAPTAAYILTVPMLVYAVVAFAQQKWTDGKLSAGVTVVLGAMVIGYMGFLGHLLTLGVGPEMLPVAILPAALIVLTVLPLYPGLSKKTGRTLVVCGLLAAIAMSLFIRLDPMPDTVAPYSITGSTFG